MAQNNSLRVVFSFFLVLFCIALYLSGKLIAPFFSIIILGIVFAGAFNRFYRFLSRRINPAVASILVCIIILFLVLIPVMFFVGVLSKEAYDLYLMGKHAVFNDQLKNLLQDTRIIERVNKMFAYAGIDKTLTFEELLNPISEMGRTLGYFLFQKASFLASNVFKFGVYFCFMLLVVFYLLIDGHRVIDYIYDLSPLPYDHNKKLFEKFMGMSGAVLIGNGLGGLIQGGLGGAAFAMLGFNTPFLWGVIMGFLAFLPIVGVGLVLVPGAALLLLNQRIAAGIFLIIFYAALSWGVEYVFKPKVVGDRVRMHPLIVFFAIIGGLKVYGLLGIIYGPLIITFFLTLAEIYFSSFQIVIDPEKVQKKEQKCLKSDSENDE